MTTATKRPGQKSGRRGGDNTQTHNSVVKACRDYLLWQGAWEVKILGGLGQRAGLPDVIACLQGRFVAVEVKTGSGSLTKDQTAERRAIEAAGGIYIVASDVLDVQRAIKALGLERLRSTIL